MNPTAPVTVVRAPLLSEQLEVLRSTFAGRHARMDDVIAVLQGRAYTLLVVVFALPFVPPVTVPGASTPLGIFIAGIAVQQALGRLPWLPRRFLHWSLPPGFFCRLVPVTARIVRKLERILHPRWPKWTVSPTVRGLHYGMITAAALMLALPLPIPFSNVLPGWAILLTACGLLERDGICIFFGYVSFVLTIVFFAVVGTAATGALTQFWDWLR